MNEKNDPHLAAIEELIGYQFKNKQLGLSAITTRGYSTIHSGSSDNQALEFLGDAVLSMVTAEMVYAKWSQLKNNESFNHMTPEGVMTKIRQEVVNNQHLDYCARKHDLCEHIYDVEENHTNDAGSNITHGEDIIEALIAAIYLDNDKSIDHAKEFILRFLDLSSLLNDEERLLDAVTRKNQKDRLIHKFQKLMKQTPCIHYPEIEDRFSKVSNTHHFVLGISIDGALLPGVTGEGQNKTEAEYEAADKAYQYLENIEWDISKIG